MTPCSTVSNATSDEGGCRVPGKGGNLTLRDALAHSQNPVAVRLMDMAGSDNVIKLARDLGVTEEIPNGQLHSALGSSDIIHLRNAWVLTVPSEILEIM